MSNASLGMTPPNGRGQGQVTRFLKFCSQSYLWNRWNYALLMSCADWYRGVLLREWQITERGFQGHVTS